MLAYGAAWQWLDIKAYLCSNKNAPNSLENFHKLLHLAIELTSKTTCFDTLDDIITLDFHHLPQNGLLQACILAQSASFVPTKD